MRPRRRKRGDRLVELYRQYDARGRLLYVGFSMQLMHRLATHKSRSHWWRNVSRIEIQRFEKIGTALKTESALIRKERPLYNSVPGGKGSRGGFRLDLRPNPSVNGCLTCRKAKKRGKK